jgi:hypothetical protein
MFVNLLNKNMFKLKKPKQKHFVPKKTDINIPVGRNLK